MQAYDCALVLTVCVAGYLFVVQQVWIYVLTVGILYMCLGVVRQRFTAKLSPEGKAVLITGCDSGLGNKCARYFDELGFIVFAGCLDPAGPGAKRLKSGTSRRLHTVALDVTQDESVKAAHDYVVKHLPNTVGRKSGTSRRLHIVALDVIQDESVKAAHDYNVKHGGPDNSNPRDVKHLPKTGLWAVVNNAGIYIFGDVEWLTVDLYNKNMDVNFYGAVRIITTFMHLIRKSKGRIVAITSVKGVFSWPGDSPYHATKHALETVLDSLRLEATKFGVKVAKIQPGNFSDAVLIRNNVKRYEQEADEMWAHASEDVRATYGGRQYIDHMVRCKAGGSDAQTGSSQRVSDAIEDAVLSERPRTSYVVFGVTDWLDLYALLGHVYSYLPTWLSDRIIARWTKCDRFPDYGAKSQEF